MRSATRWAAPVGVMVLAAIAAGAFAQWIEIDNEQRASERFEYLSYRLGRKIHDRFRLYEEGLAGLGGAAAAAGGAMTGGAFDAFVASREMRATHPGLRAIGLIEKVAREDLDTWRARAAAEDWRPIYVRTLALNDGPLFVIRHVAPFAQNAAMLGLDVGSDAPRRATLMSSIERGAIDLSAPMPVSETDPAAGTMLVMMMPIFDAGSPPEDARARRDRIRGAAFAAIIVDEIMGAVARDAGSLGFAITDVGSSAEVFSVGLAQPAEGALTKTIDLALHGRVWRLRTEVRPDLVDDVQFRPAGLAAGVVLALGALTALGLVAQGSATTRKREAAVQQARLAAIVSGSGDAVVGVSPQGVVTEWNSAAERLFELSAEAALGRPAALVTGGVASAEAMARAALGIPIPPLRAARRRSDGATVDVSVSLSPIHDGDGAAIGVAMVLRDISDLAAAERRVRETNAWLNRQVAERTRKIEAYSALQRAILAQAGYAVFAVDPDGILSLMNPAAEEMLGWSAVELVGAATPIRFFAEAEVRARAAALAEERGVTVEPTFEAISARALQNGRDSAEWTFVRRDGSTLPALVDLRPILDDDGAVSGILGIAMDLTERKRAEAEIEAARLAAEAANEAKGAFLATMSHEIRTPMNGVLGMNNLLLRSALTDQQRRWAETVQDSAEALLAIIDDILDMSKLEAGRMELEAAPFDLGAILDGVTTLMGAKAAEKGLAMRCVIAPEAEGIWIGDAARLRQILFNLVGNAVKFTAAGEVEVRADRAEPDGLVLTVRDTGIGMTAEQQGRLFQKFTQADASITRRFGGTGLGLAITRELALLMGGDISVTSVEGEGSTFRAVLPLARGAGARRADDRAAETAGEGRRRILLAEDNPVNAEIAMTLLQQAGHEVVLACDGAEALAVYRTRRFDVILMDAQMPVMDGEEATRAIREHERAAGLPRTPVIALTANVMTSMQDGYREAGMDDFVSKPFRTEALFETIARWTARDQDAA
ncbi:MAG: ATP-binding protein [Rubrimonas sp.]